MRIGREPLAADFLAEVEKLLLAEAPFEEGARVNARRAVALEVDEVAAVRLIGGMPEMHEAGVVERRRRLEARDMAAELGGFLVRLDDDRRGVPAHIAADVLLDLAVARMRRLRFGRDGVDVGGIGGERQLRALAPGRGDDRIEDLVDLVQSLESLDRIERVEPLVGLVGLIRHSVVHRAGLPFSHTKVAANSSQSSHALTRIGNHAGRRCSHVNLAWADGAVAAARAARDRADARVRRRRRSTTWPA